MNIKELLSAKTQAAMLALGLPADTNTAVTISTKVEFGDYQINGAMAAAKLLKTNPRALAQQLVQQLDLAELAEKVEIAGPGFINVTLRKDWLATQLVGASQNPRLTLSANPAPQTVVVDYSAPNLAKEMHVGHLRSTIIGDAVVRCLEFWGDNVIRQNHMGDWGTQFGMLIAHLEDKLKAGIDLEQVALADLEDFYREAKKRFDDEDGFADKSRDYVVKLQSGDAHCQKLWQLFIDTSIKHSDEVYKTLKVTLGHEHIKPESAYNAMLQPIVDSLKQQGLAVESEGALVVFLQELADKEGNPSPFIVQKTGGGFLYATTDLAACQYRSVDLAADRIVIFTDARQALHFKQVELVARKAGLLKDHVAYDHCPFGTMMGEDGKPFKTRTGGTVKLAELLEEAVVRAQAVVEQKSSDLSVEEMAEVARKVGIGAVKFADLSKNRTSDYVFSWDAMLSFEGATAPYLQYAYTRVSGILRRAGIDESFVAPLQLLEEQEKQLAVKLLRLEETLQAVMKDAVPNLLCNYLYELSSQFMSFYEACPILKEGIEPDLKNSRLMLSILVARTLKQGLDLLGIEVMERM
ncbi:MAG: arginine--tRNA ligase [Gammaproteobacteria bacterium]|nr:arginine--tRNA ligase [Gammaproteobacteria bacterium]MBU2059740.1 arginine--tRNA ligase [Gammaproteobacteria bacterium]MBU2175480.1 arginine--tRNA ligase [Gammaproteobacteria bacterium]MBU2245612.1 arginine--tRNA ligase [Gammaproteobacteria bacterium]MBU2342793.1 arginine--tRNA ligase [Gammaproteobacteria bacterium]